MLARAIIFAVTLSLFPASWAGAQEGVVSYKAMSPELAFDLARAALASCRERGYQVAVAVVDRFGITQVMLRDRFAGPHTPTTAAGKAWTAVSFRTNTSELVSMTQPGTSQAGMRSLPGVVILGGGVLVQGGGTTLGAVGVSGAPGGEADDACANAGMMQFATNLNSDKLNAASLLLGRLRTVHHLP